MAVGVTVSTQTLGRVRSQVMDLWHGVAEVGHVVLEIMCLLGWLCEWDDHLFGCCYACGCGTLQHACCVVCAASVPLFSAVFVVPPSDVA